MALLQATNGLASEKRKKEEDPEEVSGDCEDSEDVEGNKREAPVALAVDGDDPAEQSGRPGEGKEAVAAGFCSVVEHGRRGDEEHGEQAGARCLKPAGDGVGADLGSGEGKRGQKANGKLRGPKEKDEQMAQQVICGRLEREGEVHLAVDDGPGGRLGVCEELEQFVTPKGAVVGPGEGEDKGEEDEDTGEDGGNGVQRGGRSGLIGRDFRGHADGYIAAVLGQTEGRRVVASYNEEEAR